MMRYWLLSTVFMISVVSCGGPLPVVEPSVMPSPTLGRPTPVVSLPMPDDSLPSLTPQFYERRLLGYSQRNRPIMAYRFGWGKVMVALIGDIHGGTEENTYRLMVEVVTHYLESSTEVPSDVTLWIIPTINPDGLARGTRFNARGVDLNRNADTDYDACAENDWSANTFDRDGSMPGGGGRYPFSEVEARLLRDFALDAQVVIAYHSQGGMIVAAGCGHDPSHRLAHILAQATGYQESPWGTYPVTGSMVDYLASRGVAAAEVELTDKIDTELERNLKGIQAVMESVAEIVSYEY